MKFGMSLLAVLLLVTGCFNFGPEDVTVRGTITIDGKAPDPEAVQVVADGTDYKGTIAADGSFEIILPSPGRYTLKVVGEGIAGGTEEIALTKGKGLSGVVLEAVYRPPTPLLLDLEKTEHTDLIEIPYEPLDMTITEDPFGDTAMFFGPGSTEQRPEDTYDPIRFVVIDYPAIDDFEVRIKSLGNADVRDGNRTLTIIFGYEDMQNWWMFHLTDANSARVARIADGAQIDRPCRPLVENIWVGDSDKYQEVQLTLETQGSDKVLNAWIDGEATPFADCRFPAENYTPGKIGFGGSSGSSNQSWYFKDIYIDLL